MFDVGLHHARQPPFIPRKGMLALAGQKHGFASHRQRATFFVYLVDPGLAGDQATA